MSSALIDSFGAVVTVTRYGDGAYVNGTYVAGTTSTFDVIMASMPMTEKEMQILTDGEIEMGGWLKGYTATELFTVDTSDSDKADEVAIDGTNYVVMAVERWQRGGLPHYKVRLVEKDE